MLRSSLTLLLVAFVSAPALAVGAMDGAIQDYNARKYSDCLAKCQQALKTGQNPDQVHYYMGLCYQGLSQVNTARSEYMWVYQYSKNYGLRSNAYTAIQNLERYASRRTYEGNGNSFDRFSPENTKAAAFQQARAAQEKADEAAAAQVMRGGGG